MPFVPSSPLVAAHERIALANQAAFCKENPAFARQLCYKVPGMLQQMSINGITPFAQAGIDDHHALQSRYSFHPRCASLSSPNKRRMQANSKQG